MNNKIQSQHLNLPAYIYLRQSTPRQLLHHQESTQRQYALQEKAKELGWLPHLIRVLDGDLGQSGSSPDAPREDFKTLVADVSMGKVGAIFALEASRLSRCCADWHRLLELATLGGTLIIDEDGCYDPSDFNDQLLLGLKGTMSQAELHFMRARLQGGRLSKARKGELRIPLAVGLFHDELGRIVLDPDQQVQQIVRQLFDSFRQTGSAYGVAHDFADKNLLFPKRIHGGAWDGELQWERLSTSRALSALKNPAYAGVYAYGQRRYIRRPDADGTIHRHTSKLPMESWAVKIDNHHPAYIDWPTFLENQAMLRKNQTVSGSTPLPGPVREGRGLLQGLLLCARCGRRLGVRYHGDGGARCRYLCGRLLSEGLSSRTCMSLSADPLDQAVSLRAIEAMQPMHIEIALKAIEQFHHQQEITNRQWQLRLERAGYEAALAQRRYEKVDPDNRLVAATLETQWNEALAELDRLRKQYEEQQQNEAVTAQEQESIRRLAHDLPALWNAPSTQARDRKRILRLLIKDITVEKLEDPRQTVLHLRWQGGACEDIVVQAKQPSGNGLRYPTDVVEQVRQMASSMHDGQIAAELNRREMHSATNKPFTSEMIRWIRHRHDVPGPSFKRCDELTVREMCEKFGVSHHVVYYWIERGIVSARRATAGSAWLIALNAEKELELNRRLEQSTQIHRRNMQPS
ncbi:MAG TPA: recombinase family protein [Tepidisphaeraceae bacterium]|nr:recombinase family protein [Tepidisphaeraceae bacterium]